MTEKTCETMTILPSSILFLITKSRIFKFSMIKTSGLDEAKKHFGAFKGSRPLSLLALFKLGIMSL